jgi:hypothetical protein
MENVKMSRYRSGILGMTLMVALAGCGESGLQEGPGGFTPTDTKPLEPLADQMKEMMKKKDYTKQPVVPTEKDKSKGAEKKK